MENKVISKEFISRIQADVEALAVKFPQFKLYRAEREIVSSGWRVAGSGEFYFLGKLKTRGSNLYTVALCVPRDYPFGELRAFVIDPYISSTEHRFNDGHLCLYGGHGGGVGQKYESGRTGPVAVIAWTAAWLHAYESWKKTGVWPTIKL
ncbi:MAG TPA: hypothetical protein PKW98_08750 [Candidatus Wallbacteria bacterium]|nr:hypothetical protein [Candidatus Wallbacteria bacterium]